MGYLAKKKILNNIRSELELERSSFISHWRDLSDYILPRRARFTISDVNKGDRRNQKINDNTGTLAARTLRFGMLSGVTSPARPWFRLATPDPAMAEFGAVKEWLYKCQLIMSNSFLKSNLYNTLPLVYGDMGTFATAPFSVQEVFNGNVLHTESYPVGSYMIAKNEFGIVDTFVREYRMSISNFVRKFVLKENGKMDWSNASMTVKSLWDSANYQTWVDVCHVIMPNTEYDPMRLESKFKKYASVYFEIGISGTGKGSPYPSDYDDMKLLDEKGFDMFPILCPRWEVTGEDVYGTNCPGMEALGDIKALQLGEKKSYQAIDKMIDPPMVAPATMKSHSSSTLPGDITYLADRESFDAFKPAYQINFQINQMEAKQEQTRSRIKRAYYEDLFLMLANDTRSNITAEEIRARKEERLLAVGPVLEQLNQDALDPLINLAFEFHRRQGLLPPPPPELSGVDLKVEYISVMAQAQKLITIGSVERFTGYAQSLIALRPETADKVDMDQMIDIYGEITSVPPSIIRTDDQVESVRMQREEQFRAQQQAEIQAQRAQTIKTLADAPTDGENALTDLINQAQAGS